VTAKAFACNLKAALGIGKENRRSCGCVPEIIHGLFVLMTAHRMFAEALICPGFGQSFEVSAECTCIFAIDRKKITTNDPGDRQWLIVQPALIGPVLKLV
jgi:hypothetical protein